MKLHSITLTNFRQFKGTQTFDLPRTRSSRSPCCSAPTARARPPSSTPSPGRLYGNMSEDVEQQDRMVTDSVWRALPVGDSIEVAVEVRLRPRGPATTGFCGAPVPQGVRPAAALSPQLQLWTTKAGRLFRDSHAPQETIYTILPRRRQSLLLLQR